MTRFLMVEPEPYSEPPTETGSLTSTNVVNIGDSTTFPHVIYVSSTAPVYCYQVTGVGNELGSALIPSMFSITQQRLAFYAANTVYRDMVIVFRDTCENYFKITDGIITRDLYVIFHPIPGLPGSIVWRWSKVRIPNEKERLEHWQGSVWS